ncbi:SAM-dependent methyltransferase [Pseudonocardia acaciae]|uniref:SAM-dependent methyltransferase n=1 Tax=Pseudonocardia acaciae TaxID=551276 RepID=UPI000684A711|nr:SAM-dependent methyltransferase [Pseudonocardia acaciae]
MAYTARDNPRRAAAKINGVPHSARIWNYWLGGRDHYPADREAGEAWITVDPGIVPLARQSRRFLIRVVRFLAGECGIRQFLDIGTGLPTMQNTHEVAQGVTPGSKIVYVDNDPMVLAHARALLTSTTPEGATAYVDADFHDPDVIIAGARGVLDFAEPIAVMFMGVLGHVADYREMLSIVSRVVDAVPSGSYLALWDGTNTSREIVRAGEAYANTGAVRYVLRSPNELTRCFEGLRILDPGLVTLTRWRPEPDGNGAAPEPVHGYGAVARKP